RESFLSWAPAAPYSRGCGTKAIPVLASLPLDVGLPARESFRSWTFGVRRFLLPPSSSPVEQAAGLATVPVSTKAPARPPSAWFGIIVPDNRLTVFRALIGPLTQGGTGEQQQEHSANIKQSNDHSGR